MIISDREFLELYAQYRERLMLGPVGPYSNTANELPCLQPDPPNLRWLRHGEPVPFIRWASESGGDPLPLPGRQLVASRLLALPTPQGDLESNGVIGVEHESSLWHAGLAILGFSSEAIITTDDEPLIIIHRLLRALRRLSFLAGGYQEPDPPDASGWGYMLRADAVDDTTKDDSGSLVSNYCRWLSDADAARNLEPSVAEYVGMLSGLLLARRTLLRSPDDFDTLIAEIETRIRTVHEYLASAAAYRIRRRDSLDVVHGPFAFAAAWPLAVMLSEVEGSDPIDELRRFRSQELDGVLVEFSAGADRRLAVDRILRKVADALWSRVESAATEVMTEDTAVTLRLRFTAVWIRDVVFPLRRQVDAVVEAQLRGHLEARLSAWLDAPTLDMPSSESLGRALWTRMLARTIDPRLMPSPFECVQIPLFHVVGPFDLVFPTQTITVRVTDEFSFDVEIPDVHIAVEDEPWQLTLTSQAMEFEVSDGRMGDLTPCVRVSELAEGVPTDALPLDGIGPTRAMAFSPTTEEILASGHSDGVVRLRDVSTSIEIQQVNTGGGSVECVSFSPDGRFVAAGTRAGHIIVFPVDPLNGDAFQLPGHVGGTLALAWREVPLGGGAMQCLASGGADRHIRLWNTTEGVELRSWEAHGSDILAVQLLVPGPAQHPVALVSAEVDGSVRIWDITIGRALAEPVTLTQPIRAFAFAEDNRAAVIATDRFLGFWHLDNGIRFGVVKERLRSGVTAIDVSPDESFVVVGAGDGSVYQFEFPEYRPTYLDRFNRDDPTSPGLKWTVVTGDCETNGQRLISNSEEGLLLFVQPPTGPDYTVAAVLRNDLRQQDDTGSATQRLIIRATQSSSGHLTCYVASVTVDHNSTRIVLSRIDDDVQTELMSVSGSFALGQDHSFEVRARLGQISVLIDDLPVIDYEDASPIGVTALSRGGLAWQRDPLSGPTIHWDDFRICLPVTGEAGEVAGSDAVTAIAISNPASPRPSRWKAVATPVPAPAYPWRLAAVTASAPDSPPFDPIEISKREDDAMLLSLAHGFLGVPAGSADFDDVVALLFDAPEEFPHDGAANGWEGDFRWGRRAGDRRDGTRPGMLGNGLDLLVPTTLFAAVDPDTDNRRMFREALLLDPD